MESWVGTKKKYFVAATIKCAYPFPKSKKRSLACRVCGTLQNTLPNYCPRPGFPYYNLPTSHREWEPSWSWSYGSWTMQSVSI